MHDRHTEIENRVTRMLADRIVPAVHTPIGDLSVEAWPVDGGGGEPVEPAVALGLGGRPRPAYQPFSVGDPWGPPWGTTWLHLTGAVPDHLDPAALEIVVDLGWTHGDAGRQAEGLAYLPDGGVIKGVNPFNQWLKVAGRSIDLYVEAAANPRIGGPAPLGGMRPTQLGDRLTAGDAPLYRLLRADLNVFDEQVHELVADVEVLDQLGRTLPLGEPRKWQILLALDHALDLLDPTDVPGTAAAARSALRPALTHRAHDSAHRISAIGHAHIDSAWLWPVRETVRKVARTTANQLNLLEAYPEHMFAMSSAQQYAWLKSERPEVYRCVENAVLQGRFLPVGGMWVESDTNMVGSEAMVRQFLYGQTFFRDEFGAYCEEAWLPDSFGYSAGLPQIIKLAGLRYFFIHKMSWNRVNHFPHHTFWWEGIDGTRIFTHLTPIGTYNAQLTGQQLDRAVTTFRDKGAANHSLAAFGHGDGGGGPTREMIQRARRTRDLEGSPAVTIRSPHQFFIDAEAEYRRPPVWTGELYLENHRGTYTSQAKTKQGNRRSEHLLREAEQWSTAAAVHAGHTYPYEELARIWKLVLLLQFHDILPGSSIAWVHREARSSYASIIADLTHLIDAAQQALVAAFGTPSDTRAKTVFNGAPVPRHGVGALSAAPAAPEDARAVSLTETDDGYLVSNDRISITVDARGLITSAVDLGRGRQAIPRGQAGNLFQLHTDAPNAFDAWDIDETYRHTVTDLTEVESLDADQRPDGSVHVRVGRRFGASSIAQTLVVRPGGAGVEITTDVEWHEQEKLLKLAFPIDVHADRAAYETQFGHLYRPTHENTSWDSARFEVCAHRWVHIGETGFGVGIANDSTHGHDVTRHTRSGGGTYSVVRLSLLRGPRFPDPDTDQDRHTCRVRIELGADIADAVAAGYQLNLPERRQLGAATVPALASVEGQLLLETIKLTEDRSGDVIIRGYEPFGGHGRATITPGFGFASVSEVDLLERPIAEIQGNAPIVLIERDGSVTVALRPFQIVSLRFSGVRRERDR